MRALVRWQKPKLLAAYKLTITRPPDADPNEAYPIGTVFESRLVLPSGNARDRMSRDLADLNTKYPTAYGPSRSAHGCATLTRRAARSASW